MIKLPKTIEMYVSTRRKRSTGTRASLAGTRTSRFWFDATRDADDCQIWRRAASENGARRAPEQCCAAGDAGAVLEPSAELASVETV